MDRFRVAYLVGAESIEIREEPRHDPRQGELRVGIKAATTCGTDVKVYRRGGHPRMLKVPGPFGHEMAGVIQAAGPGVARWREGDSVVVANSASCGFCEPCRSERENLCEDLEYLNGAYGEEILVPERFVRRSLHAKPAGIGFELAALAEPLACVLHGVELIEPFAEGASVLVSGGGPIGLLFVAVLTKRGCRVVLSDPNESRLEAGRAMGAAATWKVSRENHDSETLRSLSEAKGYSIAIEATGSPVAWENAIAATRPGGKVLLFGGCAPGTMMPLDTHHVHYSELTVLGGYHHRPATFSGAVEWLADSADVAAVLLTGDASLDEVDEAMKRMIRKEDLKVLIRPERGS